MDPIDFGIEVYKIHALCDVAAAYALEAEESEILVKNPQLAVGRLSIMIQLIREHAAALDQAIEKVL